jgi:hypothetical protein
VLIRRVEGAHAHSPSEKLSNRIDGSCLTVVSAHATVCAGVRQCGRFPLKPRPASPRWSRVRSRSNTLRALTSSFRLVAGHAALLRGPSMSWPDARPIDGHRRAGATAEGSAADRCGDRTRGCPALRRSRPPLSRGLHRLRATPARGRAVTRADAEAALGLRRVRRRRWRLWRGMSSEVQPSTSTRSPVRRRRAHSGRRLSALELEKCLLIGRFGC